jgi:hypothetical protein
VMCSSPGRGSSRGSVIGAVVVIGSVLLVDRVES